MVGKKEYLRFETSIQTAGDQTQDGRTESTAESTKQRTKPVSPVIPIMGLGVRYGCAACHHNRDHNICKSCDGNQQKIRLRNSTKSGHVKLSRPHLEMRPPEPSP